MSFTEEQIAFRESVRKMVARHVAPIAAEMDETDRFPLEIVKLFGEMGLMQLWVPEQYGGPNGNLTMMCIAREEISKVSPACASIAGLNTMFIMPLIHFGSEEQRKKYLPIIARGGVVTAIAISEPQAGSDVTAINTRAKRDGDCYVLNGRKQWCSYGVAADYIVVMARTSDSSSADGISAFIVEKGRPGFRVGAVDHKLGIRSSNTVELFLKDVHIPANNLLMKEGEGKKVAMMTLDLGRTAIAALSVGMAQRALDECVKYLQRRFPGKQQPGQTLQFRLADMEMQVASARETLHHTVNLRDSSVPFSKESAISKCLCGDVAMSVSSQAVSLMGSYGYTSEIAKIMRDAKIMQIYEGTNQIQRLVISRAILSPAPAPAPGKKAA